MKEKMRAILLKTLDDYDLSLVEKPKCPGKGLLIKVSHCGLCGSDLRILRFGHKNVKMPAVIGHEISGVVVETDKQYGGFLNVGDKIAVGPNVYCGGCEFCISGEFEYCINRKELAQHWQGGFAEFMAIPEAAILLGNIRLMPEGLNMAHATIAEPASSCINAQEKLNIGIKDTVLIIGAGPIGCIHITLAKAKGAKKVIIADINQNRLNLCKAFRPDVTLNVEDKDLVEEVTKLNCGMGVDVVITANPVALTQVQAVECTKRGGRIAFFGGLKQGNSKPGIDTNIIHYNSLTVIGTFGYAPKHFLLSLELISTGRIPADKLVTHVMKIDDFKKGVEHALSGKVLKVVFEF